MKQDPVVHFEMPYKDHERVMNFYSRAFGWNMHKLGSDMGDYVLAGTTETDKDRMIKTPGNINGGFYKPDANNPAIPSVVISVENLVDSIEKVKATGGEILGEPVEIPGIGNYVSFKDTEGNRVGMLQPPKGK
jgi:predicted enzyme related to lactoylglutathione lyase